MIEKLREGEASTPTLRVSKWIRLQVLLDLDELTGLLDTLGEIAIAATGIVVNGEELISKEQFLTLYAEYLDGLRQGKPVLTESVRRALTSQLTATSDALFVVDVDGQRQMVRPCLPVIQLQPHGFTVDSQERRVHSTAALNNAIAWGIQLSYPTIYEDANRAMVQLNDPASQPNTALFRAIQKWMRRNTVPTPLVIRGEKINLSIRTGRKALTWASQLPQLAQQQLSLEMAENQAPLPERIGQQLRDANQTLAVAESCTGGSLAAQVTAIPGASDYFLGGVVSYSNAAKENVLSVPKRLIDDYGAVSEQVALAMAKGVRHLMATDWALATSGVAGPGGGTDQKPVGMVCFALVGPGQVEVSWVAHFSGDRTSIIEQASEAALKKCSSYFY